MKRTLKLILGPIIVVATLVAFGWYLTANPQVIDRLSATSGWLIFWIVALYMASFIALAITTVIMLRLFDKRLPLLENFLLTCYSSIVNFFGPAQSGPGVRAVYLKVKHHVKIRQFIFGTLLYYAWFGVISGLMVVSPLVSWWQAILVGAILTGGSYIVIKHYVGKLERKTIANVTSTKFIQLFCMLGLFVGLQIACVTAVFYLELRSIDQTVSLLNAISYTGAANFSLFVSLTPGAIGIREAFLIFSESIHGVARDSIIAASVLDRAAYMLVLVLMFVIVLISRTGSKFKKIAENSTTRLESSR